MSSTPATYKYKFSFVIAVYDVEEYLSETVESILAQSMDFKKNCEIIFINDGSPDNSEAVCLLYQNKYPSNIKYFKQDNRGVSSARNRGLKEVEGKYVSFLDADDLLSPDTLDKVYSFLEVHEGEIDFASIKITMFEAQTGDHVLSYKFSRSRVVDIEKDYKDVQFSAASSFIKAEKLRGDFRFDERIKRFGEDLKLMTLLVLDKKKYGVIEGPVYYYRRRSSGLSSTGIESVSKDWYSNTLNLIHYDLIKYCIDRYGLVLRYLQYVLIMDLQRRFRREIEQSLSDEERREYKERLFGLLKHIDNSLIVNQSDLYLGYKLFMLGKKYGEYLFDKTRQDKAKVYYKTRLVYNYATSKRETVFINKIYSKDDKIIFEGRMSGFLFTGFSLMFKVGDQYYPTQFVNKPKKWIMSLGEIVNDGNFFKTEIPAKSDEAVSYWIMGNDYKKQLPQVLEAGTGLLQDDTASYKESDRYIIVSGINNVFIQKNTFYRRSIRRFKRRQSSKTKV